jgi:hypothetical protein
MTDVARGERAGQIALHGLRFGRAGEPVTWVRHLRQPWLNPCALGQRARRHYWLAPRSDDAVGAGVGWGRALAMLQQQPFGWRRDCLEWNHRR